MTTRTLKCSTESIKEGVGNQNWKAVAFLASFPLNVTQIHLSHHPQERSVFVVVGGFLPGLPGDPPVHCVRRVAAVGCHIAPDPLRCVWHFNLAGGRLKPSKASWSFICSSDVCGVSVRTKSSAQNVCWGSGCAGTLGTYWSFKKPLRCGINCCKSMRWKDKMWYETDGGLAPVGRMTEGTRVQRW